MSMRITKPNTINAPYTRFSNAYALPKGGVNKFLETLNDQTFLDDLRLLFETPLDSVVSLRVYPFDVRRNFIGRAYTENDPIIGAVSMQPAIKVGGVNLGGINNVDISGENANLFTWYLNEIPAHFNNFLDYAPYTDIELYLPYIGFVNLDPVEVMGKSLTIQYAVDYMTGNATAYILRPNADGVDELIMTCEGRIAIDIPVTARNAAEVARNILMTGVNSAGGLINAGASIAQIATGNIVGGALGAATGAASLASTGISLINSMRTHYTKGAVGDGYNGWYAPQTPHVIITRPVINEPADYAHYYGRPSGKTKRLGDLEGFTRVASVHVENVATATQDELTEIERLLTTGVIL